MSVDVAVARLAQADRALAEAIEVADAVKLVATGKALREWATAVHAGREHERRAAVFVLRAMRNAGERIAEAQERGEVARPGDRAYVASGDISPLSDIGVTRDESSDWQRLAETYPTDGELQDAAESMKRPSLAGLMSSDSTEWYTPRHILDAVVDAMGGIDLDPCAEPAKSVPADRHFTEADDGLAHQWSGRVYMNPPYGRVIGAWVDKLADEFEAGHVTQAVALVPARTDTSWWSHLPSSVVCFVTGRLSFSDHDSPAPFPSAACYLGSRQREFAQAFIDLGNVWVRLEAGG